MLWFQGYKAQSEMVMESLDRLITSCAARHESLVCEGVHLSLNFVVQLMQRHPTIVPFLIYISNEDKHKERFAVGCLSVRTMPTGYVMITRVWVQAQGQGCFAPKPIVAL